MSIVKIINGIVYINNELLHYDSIIDDDCNIDEIEVENYKYYVLGGNRINSIGFKNYATISKPDIKGLANYLVFPL